MKKNLKLKKNKRGFRWLDSNKVEKNLRCACSYVRKHLQGDFCATFTYRGYLVVVWGDSSIIQLIY